MAVLQGMEYNLGIVRKQNLFHDSFMESNFRHCTLWCNVCSKLYQLCRCSWAIEVWDTFPFADSLNQKCLRIHIPEKLMKEKPQSESHCPTRTRNLQMWYVNSWLTSVGRSKKILASFTQVEISRMKLRSGNTSHLLQVNNVWCILFSVACVMQVMSATRVDTYTNELKNSKDQRSETNSKTARYG